MGWRPTRPQRRSFKAFSPGLVACGPRKLEGMRTHPDSGWSLSLCGGIFRSPDL